MIINQAIKTIVLQNYVFVFYLLQQKNIVNKLQINSYITSVTASYIISITATLHQQIVLLPFNDNLQMSSKPNIFQQATQLVSLDCSSITGQNIVISHQASHSLNQSLLNLKTVLPTFTNEFSLFKQQMMQMSYYIVNQLMNTIKNKSTKLTKLQQQLIKSQSLTNIMKNQVIQLKQMIHDFMQSYSKQMSIKSKQIEQKQNQINQLKNILQLNFNSPRNICNKCENKIQELKEIIHSSFNVQNNVQNHQQTNKNIQKLIKNYDNNGLSLVQMSESIVYNGQMQDKKKSLQIIQQQTSQVTSITDNLQSQRNYNNLQKQQQFSSKQTSQIVKSTRSGIFKQKQMFIGQKQKIHEKISQYDVKSTNSQVKTKQNGKSQTEYEKTINQLSPKIGKVNILYCGEQRYRDNFSSRITKKQQTFIQNINHRRGSQKNITDKSIYDGFKISRKSTERKILSNKNVQNIYNHIQSLDDDPNSKQTPKQNSYSRQNQYLKQNTCFINSSNSNQKFVFKMVNQDISKSSSTSDLHHFGDSQKININLPKKFQSPKNMNFVKKNSSRTHQLKQQRNIPNQYPHHYMQSHHHYIQQRIKTQPTPRKDDFQMNKQNVKLDFYIKPSQTCKKIFTKKKTIISHANKANNTSRVEPSKLIQIKYTLSPQKNQIKSSHLLKVDHLSSLDVQQGQDCKVYHQRNNSLLYSSINSNISNINSSAVKSHHQYHSTGKNTTNQTPKNVCSKNTSLFRNSFSKYQNSSSQKQKFHDRKCSSKSKQKLKVTSKNIPTNQTIMQQQQKFIKQMNGCFYSSKNNNNIKLNKNMYVNLGASKIHLKNNLKQIKLALKSYQFQTFLMKLQEVYYDGKLINSQKQGFGKIIYDNGIVFQGYLKKGKKQGNGKIIWNGVDLYDGEFINDNIQGQGYLKSLRLLTQSGACPKILDDSSYFGRFTKNKFDGMGTLFLNQKQKIVTKFKNGIPFGQLTFYTQADIQFGHWPSQ